MPASNLQDGAEAIAYFGRVANPRGGVDAPLACFIDIKMPGYTGFQVLDCIRAVDLLDRVPVFMLTTSDDRRDILKAARLGAQCFLVKYPSAKAIAAALADAKLFGRPGAKPKKPLFAFRENLLPPPPPAIGSAVAKP